MKSRRGVDYVGMVRERLMLEENLLRMSFYRLCLELDIPESSLCRYLRGGGTSYSQMMLEERQRRLNDLLASRPRATGKELATAIGYSDSQTLTRAIHEWYGTTLTGYRQLFWRGGENAGST